MAMSMQQIASLLCDAPPRLVVKSRKRRPSPPPPQPQTDLEQRLSCIPGALASRFLGGISLCQVRSDCCPNRTSRPHGEHPSALGTSACASCINLSLQTQYSGPAA
jgi:hypothetical protein